MGSIEEIAAWILRRWNVILIAFLFLSLWFLFRMPDEEVDGYISSGNTFENQALVLAIECVKESGQLIKSNYRNKNIQVQFKGDIDLVTHIDKQSEDLIQAKIKAVFPSHHFLGEESGEKDLTDAPIWIVDPLDGTTNFVHGIPFIGVSVALVVDKQVVVGAVYNPILDELFTAIRGKGAFLNGERISVSQTSNMQNALVATGFPYDIHNQTLINNVVTNLGSILRNTRAARRLGAAAIDMCYAACGIFDLYYEVGVRVWDISAASLIVQEAGGVVEDPFGEPWGLFKNRVLTGNSGLVRQFKSVISKM